MRCRMAIEPDRTRRRLTDFGITYAEAHVFQNSLLDSSHASRLLCVQDRRPHSSPPPLPLRRIRLPGKSGKVSSSEVRQAYMSTTYNIENYRSRTPAAAAAGLIGEGRSED